MLSKKECLEALNDIENELCELEELRKGVDVYFLYDESLDKLIQLINEHFDNPPLKFEELKVGMWVWDNKRKEWCVLSAYWKDALNRYYISGLSDSPFEENRFHRKQVE